MYLHPIVVHFPIALLTLYSLFELTRFKKFTDQTWYFNIKAIFVILGTLGALVAAATGPAPAMPPVDLVGMHQLFAKITIIIFGLIALAYAERWIKPSDYSGFILRPFIIIPLALLGLASITITGGLGGAMVYGTNFDPLMAPVFKILGVY